MEKIIFFGLIIPILIFVVYLGGRAIMTGFSAKSANRSGPEIDSNNNSEYQIDDSEKLRSEIFQLNELLKSDVLNQDEFDKAKKKILDN